MKIEIWKDIEGYEGLYQVSTCGRVKSLGNGNSSNPRYCQERILKQGKDDLGYCRVVLCKDGKMTTKKVHRLVAQAFIPNPLNLPQVNHKDKNPSNNSVENLEWCTNKYNVEYSMAKKVLCVETGIIYHSIAEAEKQTTICNSHISQCCKGKRKTAGKFHWRYV